MIPSDKVNWNRKMKVSHWLVASIAFLSDVRGEVLLKDDFNYPNGRLVDTSASVWRVHSRGDRSLMVDDGSAIVGQSDTLGGGEDVHRLLASPLDPITDNSTKLYAGFTVNFKSLPIATGNDRAGTYFAHFRSEKEEQYARVGASLEGAAEGMFRLGIANESWSSAASTEFPWDLSLGVSYTVVVCLDFGTDQATLWVNPADEASPRVTATDILSFAGGLIDSFGLRQGVSGSVNNFGASGQLLLDNLTVATQFSEVLVVPEPSVGILMLVGFCAASTWRRRRPVL